MKGEVNLRSCLSRSVSLCAQMVAHGFFRCFIIATIVFAGVVIGIETYPLSLEHVVCLLHAIAHDDRHDYQTGVMEAAGKRSTCYKPAIRERLSYLSWRDFLSSYAS